MERVTDISRGRVRVGPGTLYAMLSRFEEHGMIVRTAQEGRKKWYRITENGKRMLLEEYERLSKMQEDTRGLLES